MATQPHHDDDQAKKPNGNQPPPAPKTPKPGNPNMANQPHGNQPAPQTPKPAIPNMSLDEPVEEEATDLGDLLDEEVPLAEAAPRSDVVTELKVGSEDVLGEEVAYADAVEDSSAIKLVSGVEPIEEAVEIEEIAEAEAIEEEAPSAEVFDEAEPIEEAAPASAEVFAEDAVEVTGSSAVLAEAAPVSDVDLAKLFGDAPAPAAKAEEPEPDLLSTMEESPSVADVDAPSFAALASASPPVSHQPPVAEHIVQPSVAHAEAEEAIEAADEIEEAMPASGVSEAIEEAAEFEEAMPASGVSEAVEEAAEVAEAAPASDVHVAEALVDDAVAAPASHVTPASEIIAAPASEVVAADEHPPEAAPASEIVAADEHPPEAAPASEVVTAADEIAEAAPGSAVFEAGEEVEEAAPASSAVMAEEAVEEIAEAAPASDVLFDEAVAEAGPPSEMKSGELAEEVAEAVEEASSATRKAEAVLDDEVMAAEAVSGSEVAEEAEEAEAYEAGSSAVLAEEAVANGSAVKPASQTASYIAAPSSKSKKGDDDLLVTEEEVEGVAEASAVNLGDMPRSSKGSSVTGIDKVAEALESGVDLDDEDAPENGQLAKTVPSVEFDELLDDIGDSDEHEVKPTKGKKAAAKMEDDDTATEAEAVEEEIVTSKKDKKKAKAAAKATGDDIDLDEIFSDTEADEAEEAAEAVDAEEGEAVDAEAEAAEAFGAEDAAEAEAAEALDGDMEATEAVEGEEAEADAAFFDEDDEKPNKKTKTGKKTRAQDDEDEEEEEPSAKKKGKKQKAEKAVPAAAGKGGCFLPLVGGMVLAGLVLIGGVGAGWFFAPDALHDALKESSNYTKPIKPKEAPPPTALQNAHAEMAAGKYKEAVDMLKDETKEQEVGVRGEARWFAYLKALDGKGAPDGDNAEVKLALTEIEKGENKALARQIKTTLDQKDVAANLAKSMAEKNALEKQLASTTDEKTAVEKRIEDARQVLIKGNFIKKDAQFDVAKVDEILKSLGEQRDALAAVNEVLKDGKFKEGEAGVKEVIKIKQGLEANILAVDKVLEKENTKDKGDKGVMEIVDARNKMTKDRDDLLTTIGAAFKELVEGKIVKDSADPRKDLVAGMKLARLKAESPLAIPLAQLSMSLGSVGSGTGNVVEKSFDMAKVFSELGYFRGREPFIQTPEQKLENYVALLQDRNRSHPKEMADINREADWVRSPEAKANADSQAKARYVQGLTLRNLEQFAEAKAAFEETLKLIPPLPKDNWEKLAHRSHKELVEPSAYYLPRMATLQAEGNPKAALTEATLALKAIPDNAQLHAHRGLIRYELVRGMGAKVPMEAQKDIRADAENAAKDAKFAPESAYIVGLLEEELGNLADAEKQYRQAIKMHPAMDDAAGKYRVALARLLLRDRLEAAPAAPAPMDDDKKKKDDKGARLLPSPSGRGVGGEGVEGRTIVLHPWSVLAVGAIVGQEAKPFDEIDDKETIARLTETLKLAEELIASKNDKIKGQGYLLKGSALSKLGKRSEGIKEYSKGLKLAFPGIETSEMKQLIDDHPAFQQPDASGTPSPILAERHFGEGQHYYWSKQYEQAEAQFRQAVKYYDKDARYQYFLGLSLLHQKDKKKRQNADHYFSEGARLEATASSTNPDAVREINASLERIQGQLRQYLNDYRYKAASGEPEAK